MASCFWPSLWFLGHRGSLRVFLLRFLFLGLLGIDFGRLSWCLFFLRLFFHFFFLRRLSRSGWVDWLLYLWLLSLDLVRKERISNFLYGSLGHFLLLFFHWLLWLLLLRWLFFGFLFGFRFGLSFAFSLHFRFVLFLSFIINGLLLCISSGRVFVIFLLSRFLFLRFFFYRARDHFYLCWIRGRETWINLRSLHNRLLLSPLFICPDRLKLVIIIIFILFLVIIWVKIVNLFPPFSLSSTRLFLLKKKWLLVLVMYHKRMLVASHGPDRVLRQQVAQRMPLEGLAQSKRGLCDLDELFDEIVALVCQSWIHIDECAYDWLPSNWKLYYISILCYPSQFKRELLHHPERGKINILI